MNDPIVSVIIPTYNRAHLLPQAIDSVLAQNLPDMELVVVNDGSTDATQEVLKQYATRIVSISQPNGGCTKAKHRGTEVARGQFLSFLGDDDRMLPDTLAPRVEFLLAHPEVAAVSGSAIIEGRENEDLFEKCGVQFAGQQTVVFHRPFQKMLLTDFIIDGACVFRRDRFVEVGGFDMTLRASQDWDLYLRMARLWPLACMNLPCTWGGVQRTLGGLPGRNISGSALELACDIRIFHKALGYGEPIDPTIRRRVLQRLYRLLKGYLILEAEGKIPAHSRIEVMRYVSPLPWHRRMAISIVAAMPRGLLAFGLREGRRLKRLFRGMGSPQA